MKPASRRSVLQAGLAAAGASMLARAGFAQNKQAGGAPRVIEMVARRFVYEPNEIPLKAGERVVIAIKSIDFVHGMNIPDLDRRLDLVPGRVTLLELQPKTAGEIEFVCDNFCGDGHEQMNGKFIVS